MVQCKWLKNIMYLLYYIVLDSALHSHIFNINLLKFLKSGRLIIHFSSMTLCAIVRGIPFNTWGLWFFFVIKFVLTPSLNVQFFQISSHFFFSGLTQNFSSFFHLIFCTQFWSVTIFTWTFQFDFVKENYYVEYVEQN